MIPTQEQYRALKDKYPDTFLFFRHNDDYFLMYEQAFIYEQVGQIPISSWIFLPGPGNELVRARAIPSRLLPSRIAELKLLCFGMRSQVIDEPPT